MKWAIELSEYDIQYKPQTTIKGQAVVDFITELTISSKIKMINVNAATPWVLSVDGSTNVKGCGDRLLIISPNEEKFEYALRFKF